MSEYRRRTEKQSEQRVGTIIVVTRNLAYQNIYRRTKAKIGHEQGMERKRMSKMIMDAILMPKNIR